ncbi:MAG: NUDIX domain-containing protein [Nanoarchaeota archaeon]|nr:NUDIX domain-containing protein [Nanoarchaeota archaeon]
MTSAVKIILTNNENKVLLQLRDNKQSHTGCWALFGGHIDGSETPEEALIREIKEEINYSLSDYKLIKESHVKDFGKVYWFHVTIDVGLSELTLNEGDDFNFFSYDEIAGLKLAPESKKILVEYYKGVTKKMQKLY